MTRGYGIPTPNASSRFLTSPGLTPEKASRIRISPSRGCGSSISPMTSTSRAAPCFSYHEAFMRVIVRRVLALSSDPSTTIKRPVAPSREPRLTFLFPITARVPTTLNARSRFHEQDDSRNTLLYLRGSVGSHARFLFRRTLTPHCRATSRRSGHLGHPCGQLRSYVSGDDP